MKDVVEFLGVCVDLVLVNGLIFAINAVIGGFLGAIISPTLAVFLIAAVVIWFTQFNAKGRRLYNVVRNGCMFYIVKFLNRNGSTAAQYEPR